MKILKYITTFVITIIILSSTSIVRAAASDDPQSGGGATSDTTIGTIISGADDFLNMGDSNVLPEDNIQEMSNIIYNTLLIIGIIIAVIVGLFLGIQFVTGSVEQKSKIKESLIAYIVGCVVIFGAFGIWKLVVTVLQS